MNKWIRRGAIAAGGLVVALGGLVATGLMLGEQRAARRVEVPAPVVAYRTDPAALERGRYLYSSRGCVDCHGANGGGATLADDGKGLKLAGSNLTAGNARMAAYQPVDWVRSIRHGVGADGRPKIGGLALPDCTHRACSGAAPGEWSGCEWVHTIMRMSPPAARHSLSRWAASAGPGSMAIKPVAGWPTR